MLAETGVTLQVLSGADESRLTFLAVRRWYRWSAGRIINIDIGGGSLELSNRVDEAPRSRCRCRWARAGSPGSGCPTIRRAGAGWPCCGTGWTPRWPRRRPPCSRPVPRAGGGHFQDVPIAGPADRGGAVGGRSAGEEDPHRQRAAAAHSLHLWDDHGRPCRVGGVSAERAPQIVAGALVAEASMRALSLESVDICPWALREGIILRRLDSEADGTALVETPVGDAKSRDFDRRTPGRSRGDTR